MRRKQKKQKESGFKRFIDKTTYFISIFGVLVYIPQVMKIWGEKNASGLSVLSWMGFLIGSVIWLFYGIFHKQKPLIILNVFLCIIQTVIVVGILIYQ